MRLSYSKSKNSTSLYAIESTYINGKHSSRVVEKLGTMDELRQKLGDRDVIEWAKAYIKQMTQDEEEGRRIVTIRLDPSRELAMNETRSVNGGYLFIQAICCGLKLQDICRDITRRHSFEYDLNAILSHQIYTRILYPSSKMSSYESAKRFIEPPEYKLDDVYRSLDVIAEESDYIQAQVYENTKALVDRNSAILYYDCTNYYFEIEREDELRRYGISKEHRPNPIVEMGLFMDGNGMPLAFCIEPGSKNEQLTLKPLEERLIRDFSLSKFVVCTDAGLGSGANRLYNNAKDRAYIVTQSLKKLEGSLMKWALDSAGWREAGQENTINLSEIDDTGANEVIYYKERRIRSEVMDEKGGSQILEQKLIVSYSPKYKAYQREIRAGQILRARRLLNNPSRLNRRKANDPARFIEQSHVTPEGEVARHKKAILSQQNIDKESMFDGYYGVCTNLDDDIQTIIRINKGRWEIEESFRMLKTEFRSRPVYLAREQRIKAHFLTCFLSLLIYRIIEKRLDSGYTSSQIMGTLRGMDFLKNEEGYIPAYTRTALTDALHDMCGFRTDRHIITKKKMALIQKQAKTGGILLKNT